ncbi:related to CTR2 - Protein involved in copper transport [Ustilago trichophora]|uniref:Copper transport protein n=1 Tax=Ustilago trichophora TaxID=86804 RepID=A0A5C3E9Y5_9BASI|nr:related to CTR2 - Protein involved in copper transport [Ustilago trichophora]
MDHGGMDHGGHGGTDHGGGHGSMPMPMPMPMPEMCNMNMVWNWDTTNICILSSSWRITTPLSLYLSLALICLVGVLYEWLRLYIRLLDSRLAHSASSTTSSSSLLSAPGGGHRRRASLLLPTSNPASASSSSSSGGERRGASKRRSLSSTIATGMGMTFNAWIVGAIVAGAGLGHYWFNRDLSSTSAILAGSADDKGLACHM